METEKQRENETVMKKETEGQKEIEMKNFQRPTESPRGSQIETVCKRQGSVDGRSLQEQSLCLSCPSPSSDPALGNASKVSATVAPFGFSEAHQMP